MRIGILRRNCTVALVLLVGSGCGGRTSDDGDRGANVAATGGVGTSGVGGAPSEIPGGGTASIDGVGGWIDGVGGSINVGGGWIDGIGGSISVGGTSTTDPSYCPNNAYNVAPCGGNVVGRWVVESGYLNISGYLDVSSLGLGCTSAPINGCLYVSGTWTARPDGSYDDYTTTTGNVTFTLAPACLSISSVLVTCEKVGPVFQAIGWASTTCNYNSQGSCVCTAVAAQEGGIGAVSALASGSGTYVTSGSMLTIDDVTRYVYCVSGSMLTMTPIGKATSSILQLRMNGSAG